MNKIMDDRLNKLERQVAMLAANTAILARSINIAILSGDMQKKIIQTEEIGKHADDIWNIFKDISGIKEGD